MAFEYVPGNDFFHRADPRVKIFMAVAVVIMSVWFNDPLWLIGLFLFLLILLRLAHIPINKVGKFIRNILPIAVLYFIFNLILPPIILQSPLVMFYMIFWTAPPLLPVSVESLTWAIGAVFRFLIILTVVRTVLMLTAIRDLILAMVKLRVAPEFALAMSIGMGYLPVMLDENRKIKEAQQARGWEYEFRNPISRFRALLTKMLVPSIANSMRRTQDIATAIESRGFGYNLRARTYLHEIKMKAGDWFLFLFFVMLLVFAAYIRGMVIGGQMIFGLGLADFSQTASFIRSWVTTPAYPLFVGWMATINWSSIPFVGLIPISYMHVEFGQYLFLLLVGFIAGLIGGLISRRRPRKIAILANLLISIPIWFICLYLIWPVLPTTISALLTGGALTAILAQEFTTLIAYILLVFITILWPYFGSVMGTMAGRYHGGERKVFVPPEIIEE